MRKLLISLIATLCWVLALASISMMSVFAQSMSNWAVFVGIKGGSLGTGIGVNPRGYDDYPGTGDMIQPGQDWKGMYLLRHYTNGDNWTGPTGFTGDDARPTPIAPGEQRTWSDLYLWAQNLTPTSANLVRVRVPGDPYLPPPAGYRGHLVLDYVPDSCNWTGDRDFWLDLTADNEFALPIPVVTVPLQGTRFHLDVYAPVPEPSSLAALACGLAGVGGFAMRRRKCGR